MLLSLVSKIGLEPFVVWRNFRGKFSHSCTARKKGGFLKIIGVELVTPCSEFIMAVTGLMLDGSNPQEKNA